MTGQWEKYVEKAAEAIDPTAFDPSIENHAGYVRQFRRDKACGQARVALAAVGPLIQEDTRERMVAAAGAALEREEAGASDLDSCVWVDPGRQSGQACFGGTRIPVAPFMAIVEEAGGDAAKAFWPGVTDAHIKAGRVYERGRREVLKEIADEISEPDAWQLDNPHMSWVVVQLDKDTYRQIMAAREIATEEAS